MSKKGWLSRADFNKLDELLSRLGYGGYYDFLECLKLIAKNMGAIYVIEDGDLQAWDLEDIKTIPEMMGVLMAWSNKVAVWRARHVEWEEDVLGR